MKFIYGLFILFFGTHQERQTKKRKKKLAQKIHNANLKRENKKFWDNYHKQEQWKKTAKICYNCRYVIKEEKLELKYGGLSGGDCWHGTTIYYYCGFNNIFELDSYKCTCENFKMKPQELKI